MDKISPDGMGMYTPQFMTPIESYKRAFITNFLAKRRRQCINADKVAKLKAIASGQATAPDARF
jgi:hypothetical protein